MSETAKTRSRKSATKPAVEGSDQQTVAENTPVPAAQAEPEQVANPEPPQAMPEHKPRRMRRSLSKMRR